MPDLKTFLTTVTEKSAAPTEPAPAPAPASSDALLSQTLEASGPTLMSPDELNELRRRILEGYDPPAEEMCRAIQSILADRTGRVELGAEKPKRRTRKAKPNVDGLLDDLLPGN